MDMDGRIGVNMSKQTVSNVSKQDEISEIGLSNLTRELEQIIQFQKKNSCLEHVQTQCTKLPDGFRWPRCFSSGQWPGLGGWQSWRLCPVSRKLRRRLGRSAAKVASAPASPPCEGRWRRLTCCHAAMLPWPMKIHGKSQETWEKEHCNMFTWWEMLREM